MHIRLTLSDLRQPDLRKMLTGDGKPSFAFTLSVDVQPDPAATLEFVGPALEMCSRYFKTDDSGTLVEIANKGEDGSLEDSPKPGAADGAG
jgi:hypothetical protein